MKGRANPLREMPRVLKSNEFELYEQSNDDKPYIGKDGVKNNLYRNDGGTYVGSPPPYFEEVPNEPFTLRIIANLDGYDSVYQFYQLDSVYYNMWSPGHKYREINRESLKRVLVKIGITRFPRDYKRLGEYGNTITTECPWHIDTAQSKQVRMDSCALFRQDDQIGEYYREMVSKYFGNDAHQVLLDMGVRFCNTLLGAGIEDCRCIKRSLDKAYNELNSHEGFNMLPDNCWFLPCKNGGYIPDPSLTSNCSVNICQVLTNIKADSVTMERNIIDMKNCTQNVTNEKSTPKPNVEAPKSTPSEYEPTKPPTPIVTPTHPAVVKDVPRSIHDENREANRDYGFEETEDEYLPEGGESHTPTPDEPKSFFEKFDGRAAVLVVVVGLIVIMSVTGYRTVKSAKKRRWSYDPNFSV